MSEGDEVISKEVFDKMKQRFRKEAMQAVEEAETRGYQKGKAETAALYEEQAVMWKALSELVKSQNAGKVNSTPLLKFVMGQVYKDAKKEFGGDSSDVLERLKAVLLTSNDTLASKLPELLLSNGISNNSSSNNINVQSTPFKTPNRRPSATIAAPTMSFQSSHSIVCHFRPQVFSCYFKPQPPKFFLLVKIPNIVDNVVKGIFRASEFTSYKIETEVVPLSSVTNNPFSSSSTVTPARGGKAGSSVALGAGSTQCHVLDRRHSEFKAFHQALVKAYPYIIIPWIKSHLKKDKHNTPSTSTSSASGSATTGSSSSANNKNKKGSNAGAAANDEEGEQHSSEKLNLRKRQYKMWLQFLGNIESVQCTSQFVSFISGYKSWEDTLSSKTALKNNSSIRQSTVFTINANAARGLALAGAAQAESLGALSSGAASSSNNNNNNSKYGGSSSTGHNANALESAMFDPTGRDTMGGGPHGGGGRSTYMMHKLAYQDLHTVYRDVLQLEPNATSAIDSTQNLVTSYKNATSALTVFISDIDEWSRCEPSGSYELHGLRVLSSACSFTLPNLYNITIHFQEGMCDHLEFLHGSYLSCAKDSLEGIMKVFNSKLVDKVMYTTPSSATGSDGKGGSNTSNSNDRSSVSESGITSEVSENIRHAVSVSTSWESARAARSSMLLQLMIDTAATLADEYKEITKQWEYAYTKLGGVERDPALRNARENESRALSEVIKGELHKYEENVESIKESYEATHKMQDMFVKLSGALRNPAGSNMDKEEIARMEASYRDLKGIQAIKERPVLPAGVRRDPSVKPSVTFSDPQPTPQKSGRVRTKSDHDRAAAAAAPTPSNEGRPAKPPPPTEKRPPPPAQQQQHHHEAAGNDEDTAVFDRRRPLPKRSTQGGGGAAGGPAAAPSVASKIKAAPANNPSVGGNIFGSVAPQPGAAFAEGLAPSSRVRTKSEYDAFVASQQQHHQQAETAVPSVTPSKVSRGRTTSEANVTASASSYVPASSLPDVVPSAAASHRQQHPSSCEEPLPEGWEQVVSEEGQVYYYHKVTRLSRWERPTEKVAAALNERLKQEKAGIDEAMQKRKQEYEQQKHQQEEKEGLIEQLQSKVNVLIKKWRLTSDGKTVRDISELLNTTHLIVTFIPEGGVVVGDPLTPKSNPPEIKKAYMRAVRFVHPDKLAENIDVETAMLAEGVFITLTDAFNAYRTKIENAYNAANNR